MSDITKQRSPNAPGTSLEEAIAMAKRLYTSIRNASVNPEVAAKSLGYSGTNGAALSALGTLSQYGLISRAKGSIAISPITVEILHPVSESQRSDALRKAALNPYFFQELLDGFRDCAPDVVENHLIHQGFSPARAKRVAAVFASNVRFADLSESSIVDEQAVERPRTHMVTAHSSPMRESTPSTIDRIETSNVVLGGSKLKLAREYRFPLDDENEVELRFFGNEVGAEQLESLSALLAFLKTKFRTKSGSTGEGSVKSAE